MNEHEKQMRVDFGLTFGPLHGQNVLAYLANRYHMFGTHTVGDPILMAFEEGQRSVVLDIIEKSSATTFEERKKLILEELKHGR